MMANETRNKDNREWSSKNIIQDAIIVFTGLGII